MGIHSVSETTSSPVQHSPDSNKATNAPVLSASTANPSLLYNTSTMQVMEAPSTSTPSLHAAAPAEKNTSPSSEPAFHTEDKKTAARELRQALQTYVDSNPGKHGAYLRGYCQELPVKRYIRIDENDQVYLGLPNSLKELSTVLNTLLKGHGKNNRSSMFREVTNPIKQEGSILSAYLRIKSGKVAPQKQLPDTAVSLVSQAAKPDTNPSTKIADSEKDITTPRENNTSIPTHTRQLTSQEQHQVFNALDGLFGHYLYKNESSSQKKHQTQFYNAVNHSKASDWLKEHLSFDNKGVKLKLPITAEGIKNLLHELLSNFHGYNTRVPVKTSSLVEEVRTAIQDQTNPLSQLLHWNRWTHSIELRDDKQSQAAAAEAEQQIKAEEQARQAALIKKETAETKKEIKSLENILPALHDRAFLARKLHKIAEQRWPSAHDFSRPFSDVTVTSMPEMGVHTNRDSLTYLKQQLGKLQETEKSFRSEIELRMEQLPTASELPDSAGLKEDKSSKDVIDTALSLVKNWQAKKTSIFNLFRKDNADALQQIRATLNESAALLKAVTAEFPETPNIANSAWSQALVVEKLKECGEQLKPAFKLGPIVIQSSEQKQWQAMLHNICAYS